MKLENAIKECHSNKSNFDSWFIRRKSWPVDLVLPVDPADDGKIRKAFGRVGNLQVQYELALEDVCAEDWEVY